MVNNKRTKGFGIFAVLFAIIGLLFGVLHFVLIEQGELFDQLDTLTGGIDAIYIWLFVIGMIILSLALLFFIYKKSLNPDLEKRPLKSLYILLLGASFQISGIILGSSGGIGIAQILLSLVVIVGLPAAFVGSEIGIGNASFYLGSIASEKNRPKIKQNLQQKANQRKQRSKIKEQ